MLEWLLGDSKDRVTILLELLKKETDRELKEAGQLNNIYRGIESLRSLIGDEDAEKRIDSQLVHQFSKEKPSLQQKNEELTASLETRIGMLHTLIGAAEEGILTLEEAIRTGKGKEAENIKARLKKTFLEMKNTIEEAHQLAEALQKFRQLRSVECTQRFINRLKEPFFQGQVIQIQELLLKITNGNWLRGNSEKITDTKNLFALPRGRKNLRIIYTLMNQNIVVLDVMDHRTYEKFLRGRIPTDYGGRFNVILPLSQLARAH